ncbi:hypothetical protein HL658_32475 [Azospirillum sp. RWY-5-1]|uniref:DUF1269 domain-containing protein n=1 Tax=Azospirillum oleiclasticum TaxID=2735135 RepID=A0ABX2TGG5_9PROT|nr:hypothetical protein [Azospirillum oleiclasticum]NYZ17284.1 hypothetical protein [Azospirillum oleiclasticum]NYZ23432.1 hypothetical protein [Azospirillum oleiclasticum]
MDTNSDTQANSAAWTGADTTGPAMVREAVGVFDTREALQNAIDELSLAGFERHELSLMANDETIRRETGDVPDTVEEAKHDPAVPRQSYVSPEETGNAQGVAIGIPAYVGAVIATGAVLATGGTALAAAAAAAAAGAAGGGLGGILSGWLGDKRNEPLSQHLEKGGILLWVNLRNDERERVARDILARHTNLPVDVHEVPQTAAG